MKTITLKARRTLASIMVWVLMLNSVPMMDWVYAAQNDGSVTVSDNGVSDGDVSGGDVSGGESNKTEKYVTSYPQNGVFYVSCGDSDWEDYKYVVKEDEMPEGAVSCGDSLNLSDCDLPCNFTVNKLDSKGEVVKNINVTIEALATELIFNNEAIKNAVNNNQIFDVVYGTRELECDVAVSDGDSGEERKIKYTVSDGDSIAALAEIENNGKLVFKSNEIGEVIVVASVEPTKKYAGAKAVCKINVQYEQTPDNPLVYWYKEDGSNNQNNQSDYVKVVINDGGIINHHGEIRAKDGYELLDSNGFDSLPMTGYAEHDGIFIISADGTYENIFYLRNTETGGMTDAIHWSFEVDTTAPKLDKVEFSQWFVAANVDENGNNVGQIPYISTEYHLGSENRESVKLYYSDRASLSFTIDESDWGTNEDDLVLELVCVEENRNGNQTTGYEHRIVDRKTAKDWKKVNEESDDKRTLEYIIAEPGLYYVNVTCKDKAGNELKYRSEFIYVEQSSDVPVEIGFTPEPVYAEDEEGNEVVLRKDGDKFLFEDIKKSEALYFGEETKLNLSVNNFNGTFNILDSYTNLNGAGIRATNIEGNPVVQSEGLHIITLFATDFNMPVAKLVIDKTVPDIKVAQSGEQYRTEGNIPSNGYYEDGVGSNSTDAKLFYRSDVDFTIKIKEVNFNKSLVTITHSYDGEDEIVNLEDWEKSQDEENVWIATYSISKELEGKHEIRVNCKDKAGLSDTYVSEQIVIDSVPAKLVDGEDSIIYAPNWLPLEQITWDSEYTIPDNYKAGMSSTQKLYYDDTLEMQIKIHKKNFDSDCVVFKDLKNPDNELNYEKIYNEKDDICTITYSIPETAIGTYQFQLQYIQPGEETPEFTWTSEIIEMVDITAPVLEEVTFEGCKSAENVGDQSIIKIEDITLDNAKTVRLFAKKDVTVTFIGTEANDDYKNINLKCDGVELCWEELKGEYNKSSGEWTIKYTIPKTVTGEQVLELTYATTDNKQQGWKYTSPTICIDTQPALLTSVSCGDWVSVEDVKVDKDAKAEDNTIREDNNWSMKDENVRIFCNSDATVVFEIQEENFRVQDLVIVDDYGGNKKKLGADNVTNCGNNIVKVTCTIPYSEKGDHRIFISYKDRAGNVDENGQASVKCTLAYICMDEIEAKIESVSYSAEQYIEDIYADSNLVVVPKGYSVPNRRYYNDDVEITFVITEDNLRKDGLILYNGNNVLDITPEIKLADGSETSKWNVKYTLVAQGENAETEYVLSLAYEDRGGSSTKKKTDHILIDITPAIIVGGMPTFSSDWVSAEDLADNKVLSEEEAKKSNNVRVFYKDDMTITFVIQEKNFRSEDVQVLDNGVKVDELSITANDKIDSAWDITYSIPDTGTGDHIVTLNYQDKAKNDAISYTTKCICMDNTPAEGTADGITYSQWVTAEKLDETQGKVEGIESGATESVRRFYSKDMTISFVIEETNFREDDVKVYDKYPNLVDRTKLSFTRKSATEDIYIVTYSIPAKESGEHVVTLEYQDRALNGKKIVLTSQPIMMDTVSAKPGEKNGTYSQWVYARDMSNDKKIEDEQDIKNNDNVRLYYDFYSEVSVIFEIVEDNFRSDDVKIIEKINGTEKEVEPLEWKRVGDENSNKWTAKYDILKSAEGEHIVTLMYQDRSMNEPFIYNTKSIMIDTTKPIIDNVDFGFALTEEGDEKLYYISDASISFDVTEKNFHKEGIYVYDKCNKCDVEHKHQMDDIAKRLQFELKDSQTGKWTVTYTIPAECEGTHNVKIGYKDPSGNEAETVLEEIVVIDTHATEFGVKYSSKQEYRYDKDDKIVYCKDEFEFLFTFSEENFKSDKIIFEDEYNGVISTRTFDKFQEIGKNVYQAKYVIPAGEEGKHIITLKYNDPKTNGDIDYTSPTIIMDTTKPELKGVDYNPYVVEECNDSQADANSLASHNAFTIYNNSAVTVTFSIEEKNFYPEDVKLIDQYYKENSDKEQPRIDFEEIGGIWIGTYKIPQEHEGVHKLELFYSDRSNNETLTYVSKTIVIDATPAKLEAVRYSECVPNDFDEKNRYYSNNVGQESGDAVEVTFKVLEKYFHEAGVSVSLSKDDVIEPQCNWSWKSLGNDEYEITCSIPKSEEGEYVITFSYQDRCKNGDAINVVSDTIRIDNHAATINVDYSEFVSARDAEGKLLELPYDEGTYHTLFYNQDVILTFEITEKYFHATDVVFTDDFDKDINASVLKWDKVEGKDDVWEATYKIPNTAEGKHNITLSYQDRSKNTPYINYVSKTIVVDKTAADLKNVTFGGKFNYAEDVTKDGLKLEDYQPASREDVILYYNDDMSITFEITEANFYEKDVEIRDSFYTKDPNIELKWKWNSEKAVWVATYSISKNAEGIHRVTLSYHDSTKNEPYIYYTSEKIVMDKTAAKLTDFQYSEWSMAENSQKGILKDHNAGEDFENVRLFYREDMVITFEITEEYFHAEDVHFRDDYHSTEEDIVLKWQQGTSEKSNVRTATYTIPKTEEGEHRLTLTYGDRSANEQIVYTSERIVMDITEPELTGVAFSTWKQAVEAEGFTTLKNYAVRQREDVNLYYDDTMTMKFEITEAYFNPNDLTFKDNEAVRVLEWKQGTGEDSDKWVAEYSIPASAMGEHLITLSYQDRSLNEELVYASEKIVIDTDIPVIHLSYIEGLEPHSVIDKVYYYGKDQQAKICIKETNFRAEDVLITVDTTDAVDVVDEKAIKEYLKTPANWTKTSEGYVAYVDLNTDARYDISITYKDLALREAQMVESSVVVDNQKPVEHLLGTDIAYDAENCKRMVDENNHTVTTADADTRFIYQGAMTFKFALKEINFDAEDVLITVFRDEEKLNEGSGYSYAWNKNWSSDKENYIHTLTMELGRDGQVVVDGNYQVVIEYTDRAGHALERYTSNIITIDTTNPEILIEFDNNEASEYSYSNADKSEPYYYNKDRVATITITDRNVVAEEIELKVIGKDITGVEVPFDLKTKQTPWVFDEETNQWIGQITFNEDANYELEISIDDMATNSDMDSQKFTVDKTAPDKERFKVIYSDTVKNDKESDSNNAFYKDIVTVKISIEDVTSRIYGFKMTYRKQKDASSINKEEEIQSINYLDKDFEYAEDKHTATAIFRLTTEEARQYRGNLYFEAVDMAGNHSEEISDTEKIVIVDNISPTRTVEYSAASQIVNKESLNTINGFDYATENAPVILLYNSPMEITFKINEANFYEEDIILEVNKKSAKVSSWKKEGDLRIGKLKFVEDGEYTVTLQYTDRSTNKMVDYTTHTIIVDTAKPQIYVSYSPDDVKQQIDGIKYYDKQQTATITINERNFRASDVEVVFSARDINGNSVGVPDYDSILKNKDSWSKVDDNHVAKITFAIDANYEFDIMYKDLALISSDDYVKDVFTVDQTAPTSVSVSYSVPVFEKTLQGTDYKYYNEPVVVTLVAEDETSPIHSFDYSYMRAEGVSTVNAEGIANRIDASNITYSNGRKTATATFVLPASELRAGTQINGGLEYAATNRASLTTELKDMKRYVVDSIAPTVNVEFSDCVKQANNISYYAGNIDVTINIEEANFFSEDVKVRISKDGGEQTPVEVSWRTLSVDRHVGNFKLEEEGDYRVYISYQDSSTNKMADYQSNQLTIDRTKPSVTVSGIRHNSANKKSQIGYVVKVEDVNLDINTFNPKLIAEIRNAAGNIEQIDCTDIGTVDVIVEGKSCTYTITNIKHDGIYHFESSVSDMSGNTTNEMVIEGIVDKMVSVLEYSVNRNGSTYGLEDGTKGLNNRFVKEARDVIVYETNPDEISNIVITLFKNDKSIVLVEGKDYVVNKISKAGEWFKYEYIIYATNFMEDGTYHISIYSEDKAGNIAENNLDVKNVEINFGVDKTLPKVIVTNLESKQTYPVDKLSVLMQATDNMKLVNIMVELDGKLIASWDEEQIIQMGADLQDFVFDIIGDSTHAHTVTITLTDVAGNQCIETISDFYVTTNLWVQFVNNKLLFYGSIAAVIGGGIVFIPLWRRRRRRREARG